MTAPNVPPRAKAYIPKNMKANISNKIVAIIIREAVNNAGEIPKKSKVILVFFS